MVESSTESIFYFNSFPLLLTISLYSYFLFHRTNTMIEIITTRFHEAYTWILPPEQHVGHGNFMKEQQQHMFSSYKRLNGNSHKTPLLDGDKSTLVINIWFYSLHHFLSILCSSVTSSLRQAHSAFRMSRKRTETRKLARINFHNSLNTSFLSAMLTDLQWESEIVRWEDRGVISATSAWSDLSGLYENDGWGELVVCGWISVIKI